jgi:hypothetical protein
MAGTRARRERRMQGYFDGMIVAGVDVDETLLAEVCERYGVGKLMICGSAARGTAGPASDVDIVYELCPGRRLPLKQWAPCLSGVPHPVEVRSSSPSRTSPTAEPPGIRTCRR